MSWRERPRLAMWSLIALGAAWVIPLVWAFLTGHRPTDAWFVAYGGLALLIGAHLIAFCREDAAMWREQNRRFWRPFGLGDTAAAMYTSGYVAAMGLLVLVMGLGFIALYLLR